MLRNISEQYILKYIMVKGVRLHNVSFTELILQFIRFEPFSSGCLCVR